MTGTEQPTIPAGPSNIEELFRHATARPQPPAEFERSARTALHQAWSLQTARRRVRRRTVFGLAAALLFALSAGLLLQRSPLPPSTPVATADRVQGQVRVVAADGAVSSLTRGATLHRAQLLQTRFDSSLALRWGSGVSLRLGHASRLQLLAEDTVELIEGKVYVDTDGAQIGEPALVVLTPAGPINHVGTRYLAEVDGDRTGVAVRGGRVVLGPAESVLQASAGEQLVVDAAGNAARSSVPVHGEMWRWAEQLAPPLPEADRSVADFLDWVGRESGCAVRYDSPRVERRAHESRLVGSVTLEPRQALELVLKTTDFEGQIRSGAIRVSLREAGD